MLVMHGRDDDVVDVEDAREIARTVVQTDRTRNVRLAIVPHGGHQVMALEEARRLWRSAVAGEEEA